MDARISQYVAEYLGRWPLFDEAVLIMSSSHLVKGAAVCAIMVYIWASDTGGCRAGGVEKHFNNRLTLIAAMFSCVFAEALALVLANSLEFRLRPLLVPELGMQVPDRLMEYAATMSSSSSFPSDHAVLFAAITTGIFMASRRLGIFAALYCLAFIAFPRVYLGLHYVSDILVGAVIGIICTVIGVKVLRRLPIMRLPVKLSYSHAAFIAPLSFLCLFQVATMLEDMRAFAQIPKLAYLAH
jgi:undecaprenyl-diphosphatase